MAGCQALIFLISGAQRGLENLGCVCVRVVEFGRQQVLEAWAWSQQRWGAPGVSVGL